MFPVYATLHFLPPLLLRPQSFFRNPLKILQRSLIGSLKSSAFLSTFVVIFLSHICVYNNAWKARNTNLGKFVLLFAKSRWWWWWAGALTAFGLFWEEKKRRVELASEFSYFHPSLSSIVINVDAI
jgi:hypothetical protein